MTIPLGVVVLLVYRYIQIMTHDDADICRTNLPSILRKYFTHTLSVPFQNFFMTGYDLHFYRVCDNQSEDLAVTVYISLLRRKRELIMRGKSPTQPAVLVNQQDPQANGRKPVNNLTVYNDKTQQVLQVTEFMYT